MAFSKARRLSDLVSAAGEVSSFVDASVTHADLHGTMDLTGKTVTVSNASTGDSDTTAANTAFVQQEIAALVDSAPGTLNTLNELAAALGDDASFSTTVTNSIATKLPLAGGTVTGNITMGGMMLKPSGDGGTIGFNRNPDNGSHVGDSAKRRFQINGPDDTGGDFLQIQSYNSSGAHQGNINIIDGKIGIGESAPLATLHIKQGDSGLSSLNAAAHHLFLEDTGSNGPGITFASGTSSNCTLAFGDSDSNYVGFILYDNSEDAFKIGTNAGGEDMRIDSSGRVGINRTPAISNSKLEVGGADNVPLINVEASGATGGIGIGSSHLKFYYGTTEHMAIDGNGWIRLNGGNAQQYSDNQRTYSGNENITFSSSSSAQTWTSSYYQPYQKFNFAGLHFGYSGNGAISQHFYITLMNHYSGLSINTQHSASGGNGSSYHTISFTSGGAYNTRTLKVVCTPASGQNAANTSGTIYYGTCI